MSPPPLISLLPLIFPLLFFFFVFFLFLVLVPYILLNFSHLFFNTIPSLTITLLPSISCLLVDSFLHIKTKASKKRLCVFVYYLLVAQDNLRPIDPSQMTTVYPFNGVPGDVAPFFGKIKLSYH